ncbi:hypothetical protein CTAYLR_001452 [Chrysophaeum taylorii]|uniref:PIH1 domain-containing protein 1 n=1 Tax=Chrysophaeum taylorii TaxID=2483200 RepID=A0AAD7UAI8_9STRA|nr:hypothetical protein CTAYLR_001452 [Chrysophaeum taylorii]
MEGRKIESMPPEALEAALRKAQANAQGDHKMTDAETEKFAKAFKDPEFVKMFAEYVDEISDPKHCEEQNTYLRELEAKGEAPKGRDVIVPSAGFVVKTRKADDDGTSKVFVNVVQSDKIGEPEGTKVDKGTSWQLPHILGPVRLEKDKKGDTASTFDCCFHAKAVGRARVQKPYRDMITQTAFESIEKYYATVGTCEKLLREYHVLKGVSYKTGDPHPLVVKADEEPEDPPAEDEMIGSKQQAPKQKKTRRAGKKKRKDAARRGAADDDDDDDKDDDARELIDEAPPPPAAKEEEGTKAPAAPPNQVNEEEGTKAEAEAKAPPPPAKKEEKPSEANAAAAAPSPPPPPPPAAAAKAKKEPPKARAKANGGVKEKAKNEIKAAKKNEFARALRGKLAKAPAPSPAPEVVVEVPPRGGAIPAYTITERGYFDMTEHVGRGPMSRRPKELVVAVELPGLGSVSGVDLEAKARRLSLTAKKEGTVVYSLDAGLPYEVDGDGGKAKFNTKSSVLSVTLPLVPPPETPKEVVVADDEEEEEEDAREVRPVGSLPGENDHSRWLESAAPAPRKPFATDAISPRDDEAAPSDEGGAFVAKDAFEGAMQGYVFKVGDRGLGYYADAVPPVARVEWRQKKDFVSLIAQLEAVEDAVLAFPGDRAVEVSCRFGDGRTTRFVAIFQAPVDPDRCRVDAADRNVAIVVYKRNPELWQDSKPVVQFDGALDVTTTARKLKKTAPSPLAAEKEVKAAGEDSITPDGDTTTPVAPTTFQNTLLFDID